VGFNSEADTKGSRENLGLAGKTESVQKREEKWMFGRVAVDCRSRQVGERFIVHVIAKGSAQMHNSGLQARRR